MNDIGKSCGATGALQSWTLWSPQSAIFLTTKMILFQFDEYKSWQIFAAVDIEEILQLNEGLCSDFWTDEQNRRYALDLLGRFCHINLIRVGQLYTSRRRLLQCWQTQTHMEGHIKFVLEKKNKLLTERREQTLKVWTGKAAIRAGKWTLLKILTRTWHLD